MVEPGPGPGAAGVHVVPAGSPLTIAAMVTDPAAAGATAGSRTTGPRRSSAACGRRSGNAGSSTTATSWSMLPNGSSGLPAGCALSNVHCRARASGAPAGIGTVAYQTRPAASVRSAATVAQAACWHDTTQTASPGTSRMTVAAALAWA